MCRSATVFIAVLFAATGLPAPAQQSRSVGLSASLEWRSIGNTVLEAGLGSPAGGPIDRVWFSADGSTIFARTAKGRIWRTADLEKWSPVEMGEALPSATQVSASAAELAHLPRELAYSDSAVSPRNTEEILVAADLGVWRSADGGTTWSGLNETLPNLPIARLLSMRKQGSVQISLADGREFLWQAGERKAWRAAPDSLLPEETALRNQLRQTLSVEVTAVSRSSAVWHAGTADGRIFSSTDSGTTWRSSATPATGRVERIYADRADGRYAVAITSSPQRGRVLRTISGGVVWDDLTGSLPSLQLRGVTADRGTGTIYLATSAGLLMGFGDFPSWNTVRAGAVVDTMLDNAGNQIFVALEGAGVAAALAPHRLRDPRVVSAADRIVRAAAPGSLLSVLGARVTEARIGDLRAPVLASGEMESQIQVPFEVAEPAIALAMDSSSGPMQVGVAVKPASPSIFVDRDGSPLLMDAESGLMLDASTPARPGTRVQILATGLGRVTPGWPSGLAAPLQNPPRVAAPVRVYLDRESLEVKRATLAPGYVGMYLIEVELPRIVNSGTSELYLEIESEQSNRVQLWLEPR